MRKIVVVGSLNTDIDVRSPRLPVAGETTLGESIAFAMGGKGNNQATAARRAGAEVVMVGRVGNDSFGEAVLKHCRDEGMTTRYIGRSETAGTGVASIEIETATGQNRIIVIKGANGELGETDVRGAESEIASCGAVLTQFETTFGAISEAKALSARYGKLFIINPAPFREIPDGLFNGVDYVTPNETEAEFFTGVPVDNAERARKAASKLLAAGAKNVVITLGKRGAYFFNGTEEYLVEPPAVKPVDTTGAGDAFNGGLAVALSEGMPVETALRFANCVASLSVTKEGACAAMPRRSEVDALLKSRYGADS